MTYPLSTKWSEQTVVPFHKRKLSNFATRSHFTSNMWKSSISLNQFHETQKQCKIYKSHSAKFNFMQVVHPMLTAFHWVPNWNSSNDKMDQIYQTNFKQGKIRHKITHPFNFSTKWSEQTVVHEDTYHHKISFNVELFNSTEECCSDVTEWLLARRSIISGRD